MGQFIWMSCGPLPPSKNKLARGISQMNILNFTHWQTKSCFISITIAHGPLKATECYVTMWTCFSPTMGGEHPSEIKESLKLCLKVTLVGLKFFFRNKLPMQFMNNFCNRQQLFPSLCLFFITAKLFLASSLKGRVTYISCLVMIYVDEVQVGRPMKKITHH